MKETKSFLTDKEKRLYDRNRVYRAFYENDREFLWEYFRGVFTHNNREKRFTALDYRQDLANEESYVISPFPQKLVIKLRNLILAETPNTVIPEAHEENADPNALVTEERLDNIIEKTEFWKRFTLALEYVLAFGYCGIKSTWNKNVVEMPYMNVIAPENLLWETVDGFVTKVIIHKCIDEDKNGRIWRLVETHTKGKIEYSLYKCNGTEDFGMEVGLTVHPKTKDLQPVVETGIDDLLVKIITNGEGDPAFPEYPIGKSIYAGLEPLFDGLNEAFTNWDRDMEISKGTVYVHPSMLQFFDREAIHNPKQVYYTMLNADMTDLDMGKLSNQFDMRVSEHISNVKARMSEICIEAGISPKTMGLTNAEEGRATSGISIKLQQAETYTTKKSLENSLKRTIENFLEIMLETDIAVFDTPIDVYTPTVEFKNSLTDDFSMKIDTAAKMKQAGFANEEIANYVYDDMTADQLKAMVERMNQAQGIMTADESILPV